MPDLSKSVVQSPLTQFSEPITSRYGSRYGSADTAIGRAVSSTYYDKGLSPYDDQQHNRYINQDYVNAFGNFMGDLGVQFVSGLPSLMGAATGLGEGIGTMLMGGDFSEGWNDNPFVNLTKTMTTWGEEHFPHMLEPGFQDKSFLEQLNLFDNGGQLLTSNVSTIAFLLQSYATGGLMAEAGIGGEVANAVTKTSNFRKALTALESPNLLKIANTVDDITLNTFLTTSEASSEGIDAKKTMQDKLHADRIAGLNDMSDQEIDAAAGNSLTNVFWGNMVTLGITNGFFTKLLRPMFGAKAVSSRANKWALEALKDGEQGVVKAGTKATAFEKFLFDKGNVPGMVAKSLAEQGVSESVEEDLQYSLQKVNDASHKRQTLLGSFAAYMDDFLHHGADFNDKDRAKAAGLGGLVGMGATGISSALGHGPRGEARNYRQQQAAAVAAINSSYTNFVGASVLSKSKDQAGRLFTKEDPKTGKKQFFIEEPNRTSEISESTYKKYEQQYTPDDKGAFVIKGQYETDDQGNVYKDTSKTAKLGVDFEYHKELDNLLDTEANKAKADEIKLKLYQLEKLNNLAQNAFASGTTDFLLDKLDGYKNASPQQQAEMGVTDPAEIENVVEEYKKHILRLEKNYKSTQNGLVRRVTHGSEAEHSMFQAAASELGGRIVNLDYLIEHIDKKINDKITENPELAVELNTIAGNFEEDTNVADLFPGKTTDKTSAVKTEVATLAAQKAEVIKNREKLGDSYNMYFDTKQGFKAWKASISSFEPKLSLRSKLFFNEHLSEDDMDKFVDGEVNARQHGAAYTRANSVFYADAINNFIHYYVPEGLTFESAESLVGLVNKVLEKGVQLYPDEAAKLKRYIATAVDDLAKMFAELDARAAPSGLTAEQLADEDPDTFSEEERAIVLEWMDAKKIEEQLSTITDNLEVITNKIDANTGLNFDLPTEKELKLEAIDSLLVPSRNLIEVSGFDGDVISEDFLDLPRVELEIKNLEILKDKGLSPKAKTDSTYTAGLKEAKNLLATLKKIQKLTKAAMQNRELKEKQENQLFAEGFFSVFDALASKLPAPAVAQVTALKTKDPVLASIVVPHLVNTLDTDQIDDLEVSIKTQGMALINSLEAFEKKTAINVTLSEDEKLAALNNPTKGFSVIFQKLAHKEGLLMAEDITALQEFVKTYDIAKFNLKLKTTKATTSPETLKELLNLYTTLIALQQIRQIESGHYSDINVISSFITELEKMTDGVTPSAAQMRVIRELTIFVNSANDTTNEMFQNGAALKAPAGAGKSLVVSKYLKLLAGLKDAEIMTAAAFELAAENIKTSLNSTHPANTVENLTEALTKNAIPKGVRLLVIDEAGALDNQQLTAFAAEFAKYNRRNSKTPLKFIFLYDPNQYSANNTGISKLDENAYYEVSKIETAYWQGNEFTKQQYRVGDKVSSDLSGLPFIHNLQQISPLSTTYRTNVVEIGDLQNKFKTATKVEEVTTSASSNPMVTTKDILGTFAETGSNIISVFAKSSQENPTRSRIIVVGSETKKAAYKKAIPGAQVVLVADALGITRDEVYVDVESNDTTNLAWSPEVLNQGLYTALSRASKFTHFAHAPSPTFKEDQSITDRTKALGEKTEDVKQKTVDAWKERLETLKYILQKEVTAPIVNGKPEEKPKPKPEDKPEDAPEDKPEDKPEEKPKPKPEDKPEEEPKDEVQDEPEDQPGGGTKNEGLPADEDEPLPPQQGPLLEGSYVVRRPTSAVFDQDYQFPTPTPQDELMLVKDISDLPDKSPGLRYIILQPLHDEDGKILGYRDVAVMEDNEITELEAATGVNARSLPGHVLYKNVTLGSRGMSSKTPIESYVPLYMDPISHDLQYHYGPETTVSLNSTDGDGLSQVRTLVANHLRQMYGDVYKHIENYDDVIANIEKHTRVVSYQTDLQIQTDFNPNKKKIAPRKLPRTVAPYLIIENIKLKNGGIQAKQFIRLRPDVIDAAEARYAPIYSFIEKLKNFEKIISETSLRGNYGKLRNGFGIKVDDYNTYYPFHWFVAQLAKTHQAKVAGQPWTLQMSKMKNITDMFPDLQMSEIPDALLEAASELDALVHGDTSEGKREYKGEAQKLMNEIGAQNLVITTPLGTNILLADYRTVGYDKKKKGEITDSAGVSLLGPLTFERDKGQSNNAKVKPKLKTRLAAYLAGMTERGKGSSSRAGFVRGIIEAPEEMHLAPITTQNLEDIFINGQDDKGKLTRVSQGFGLRAPLKKDLNAKVSFGSIVSTPIEEADISYLESTFEKVVPTTIAVRPSASMDDFVKAAVAEARTLSPIDQLKVDIEAGVNVEGYPEEVKQELVSLMQETDFPRAINSYLEKVKFSGTYTTGRNIFHETRALFAKGNMSAKDRILSEIRTSLNVTGVGKNVGSTAARDFIRTAVLVRMFPTIGLSKSKNLTLLSLFYYNPQKQKDQDAFQESLENIAISNKVPITTAEAKLDETLRDYEEVAKDMGVSTALGLEKETSLDKIYYIAQLSSKMRAALRAEDSAAPVSTEGLEEYLISLIESSNSAEEWEDIINAPENAEFTELLHKKAAEKGTDLFTTVGNMLADVQERSMLKTSETDALGELLSDEDVARELARFHPPTLMGMIKSLFISKPKTEAYRFAMFNKLQNSKGENVWGLYKNGLMSFVRHASGQTGTRVVRHEFFHKLFWEFLSDAEQAHLLGLARTKWGDLSDIDLEEKLAEDFSDYIPKPSSNNIFRMLWNMLKRFLGFTTRNLSSIEAYFNEAYNQGFSPRATRQSGEIERSMRNITTRFDSLDQYYTFKALLLDTYQNILTNRKNGQVLSLDEAVIRTIDSLRHTAENAEAEFPGRGKEVKGAINRALSDKDDREAIMDDFFGNTRARSAAADLWQTQKNQDLVDIKAQMEELRPGYDPTYEPEDEVSLYDESDGWNDLNDELKGLEAETFESELRDPKLKITASVKQRLLSIKYRKGSRESFGELARTFNIVLNQMHSLPTSSLNEALTTLYKQLEEYGGDSKAPSIRRATGKFMFDVVANLIQNTSENSQIRLDISFRKDSSYAGLYAVIAKDRSNTHGVTKYEAQRNPNKYTIEYQLPETSVDVFVSRVSKNTGASYADVGAAYYLFEDLDFFRSLLTAVAPLRQTNPHVAQSKWVFGKFKATYYKIRMGGGASTLESRLTAAFHKYVNGRSDTLFTQELLTQIASAKSDEARVEALQEFLNTIGIKASAKTLKKADPQMYAALFDKNKFLAALQDMSAVFAISLDQAITETDWLENRTGLALISNESDLVQQIVGIINTHHELTETNSYTRGDKKKAYGFSDESYQTSLFTSIFRALNSLYHRKFATFSIKNGKLFSNDRFLKDNIYAKGMSRIKGFIDHDSLKTKGNAKWAKYLRKETLVDFRKRHITFGFFSRLNSSGGSSYYQFLPIPSNRTAIQAAEVTVVKPSAIDSHLIAIIEAQKNRPNPKDHPDLADNVAYNKIIEGLPNYQRFRSAGLHGSTELSTKEALAQTKAHIEAASAELLKGFLSEKFKEKGKTDVSDDDLVKAARTFGFEANLEPAFSTSSDEDKQAYVDAKNDLLRKVIPIFYANFLIHQYSLSQLVYGDEAFFDSKELETKRIQIATATGDSLLSDPLYGMPPVTNILVVEDLPGFSPEEYSRLSKEYDKTDGQGFILPEYHERLSMSSGIEASTDIVLKPVIYGVQKGGIPIAIKYSAIVLTDAFIAQYPHFASYRDVMREKKIDQLVFNSAVKVGNTKHTAKLNANGSLSSKNVPDGAILKIDTGFLRIQLNPAKTTDSYSKNPTQGTAFMNTNGQNLKEVTELHHLNAVIIENKLRDVARELRITRKGSLVGKTITAISKKIRDTVEKVPGSADIFRLLNYKSNSRHEAVSLSLPLIADRAISTLANIISDSSVGFKFAGSKLVLQADIGAHRVWDTASQSWMNRELQYRDADGFCEVILPESYRAFMEVGDTFLNGNQNGLVGFRIPSTNYHSLLPMKVVNFYPAPTSAKGNVVIAPSLIVYYHGSDYDVDTLFVMRKQAWDKTSLDLNAVIKRYDSDHKNQKGLVFEKGKTILGFDGADRVLINKLPIEDYLQGVVIKAHQATIELLEKLIDERTTPVVKAEIEGKLKEINTDLSNLSNAIDLAAKNAIVGLFSTNMQDPKNRKDLLTPISFSRVYNIRKSASEEESVAEMWARTEREKRGLYKDDDQVLTKAEIDAEIYPKGQLTDYLTQESIRYNTYSGISLTGISASFGKMLGYLFETTPTVKVKNTATGKEYLETDKDVSELLEANGVEDFDELLRRNKQFVPVERAAVTLRKAHHYSINGVLIDAFSRTERTFDFVESDVNVFESGDTVTNLAIDNVKEQKLHILGITNTNANTFLVMLGQGVPFKIISKILRTPALLEVEGKGRLSAGLLNSALISPATRLLKTLDEQTLIKLLEEYDPNLMNADAIARRIVEHPETIGQVLGSLSIETKVLDMIYTGEASSHLTALSNLVVGQTLRKLIPVTETAFDYAQIFSVLKGIPNKKWKADSIASKIEKHFALEEESKITKENRKKFENQISATFRETSAEYQAILGALGYEEAEKFLESKIQEVRSNPIIYGESDRSIRAGTVNRQIRGSASKNYMGTSSSPFEDSTPMRLPHVAAGYRALLMFKNIIEKAFPVHSTTVQGFVQSILSAANVFSPIDALEKADIAQKQLLRYLTSTLSFSLDGTTLSLKVDPKLSKTTGVGTLTGVDAWADDLLETVAGLDYENNQFLANLSFTPDSNNTIVMGMTSDKVGDEEVLEEIREDFVKFANEHPTIARDIFKYGLLTNSMYYEKTGLSLVFPDSWAVTYSHALERALKSIIPIADSITQFNLAAIKDDFLFQFLRNNAELISFPKGAVAVPSGYYLKSGAERRTPVYEGKVVLDNGRTIFYDLAIDYSNAADVQDFVRQYNSDVYMRIPTNGAIQYYTKITESVSNKFYYFDPVRMHQVLDLKMLNTGDYRNLSSSRMVNNTYFTNNKSEVMEIGEKVLVYDKGGVNITSVEEYEVFMDGGTADFRGASVRKYALKRLQTIDVTKTAEIEANKALSKKFLKKGLGRYIILESMAEAEAAVLGTPNAFILSAESLSVPYKQISIPVYDGKPSKEQLDEAVAKVLGEISMLDKDNIYIILADFLAPLSSFRSVQNKIANALYQQIGAVTSFIETADTRSEISIAVQASIDRPGKIALSLKDAKKLYSAVNEEVGTHFIWGDSLDRKQMKRIEEGSLIYFGENTGLYAHVAKITEDKILLNVFDETFFVDNITKRLYTQAEFEELVLDKNKC